MQPLAQLEPANELNTGNLSISGESERQFTKKAHRMSIKIIQALVADFGKRNLSSSASRILSRSA